MSESLLHGLQIVAGIALLFGGGELFVAGSVALSLLLGIPQIVIGLTVVSLGTSAPELFVSLISTFQGDDGIAVSNVVGSNIFNVMVVLGLSALVVPLRVKSRLVRRDVPLLLGVSMAVWGMASGGRLTWQAGVALLVATLMNIVWEMRTAAENPDEQGDEFDESERATPPVAAAKLAGGLVLLVLGSQLLVRGAIGAATALGVSQTVIGLTIVSAGTSMPELVTSLVAAYKGKADLAIGNVVGSNLLNQLVILGLCATFSGEGLQVDPLVISRDLPIMVLTTLACLPIFWTGGVVSRQEGGLLVGLYGLYLVEQLLLYRAPTTVDEFRLITLIIVVPAVLIFLTWQVLAWRQHRRSV
ncbi:MAG: calcium/sodium antiporter [Prochlorococcaceae cyanobacterium]